MLIKSCSQRRGIRPGLILVGCALMLSACNETPPAPESPPEIRPETPPMTQPPADLAETGPLEQLAVQDLAARLEIAPGAIVILSAQAVTWSDGAIGCPQPDGFYTQALVEGFHIVLGAQGEEFHYHASGDGRPFMCPEERRRPPIGPGRTQAF